jgi:class 3 adenylate cyclase
MDCPSCKADVSEGSSFCIECGAALPVVCPTCGYGNPARANFCAKCGTRLAIRGSTAPTAALTAAASSQTVPIVSSAERRHLTVMFCDLVGSTALASGLDPEDLREIIGAYHRCVAETVSLFDGFVAKYMGDGVLVYFGYPQAHEGDAERAVRAGLALVERVGLIQAPARLRVRVGIATGLVIVGDLVGSGEAQERGVVGETPNLAARLQAIAEPGAVVIGPTTRRLVGDLFDLHDACAWRLRSPPRAVIRSRLRRWSPRGHGNPVRAEG